MGATSLKGRLESRQSVSTTPRGRPKLESVRQCHPRAPLLLTLHSQPNRPAEMTARARRAHAAPIATPSTRCLSPCTTKIPTRCRVHRAARRAAVARARRAAPRMFRPVVRRMVRRVVRRVIAARVRHRVCRVAHRVARRVLVFNRTRARRCRAPARRLRRAPVSCAASLLCSAPPRSVRT